MANEPLDILKYAEDVSAKSLEVARKAYDDLHERAYKLATLLIGGGGAVAAFALGRMGADARPIDWAPLAALAAVWLAAAAYVVILGAGSNELSPGNGPNTLRNYYNARLKEAGATPESALATTRHAELDLMQARIDAYSVACIRRAKAIDAAYKLAAILAPLAAFCFAILYF